MNEKKKLSGIKLWAITLCQLALEIRARLGQAGERATSQTAAANIERRTGTREFRIAAADAADGRGLLLQRIVLFAGRVKENARPPSRRPFEKRHRQPVIFARIRGRCRKRIGIFVKWKADRIIEAAFRAQEFLYCYTISHLHKNWYWFVPTYSRQNVADTYLSMRGVWILGIRRLLLQMRTSWLVTRNGEVMILIRKLWSNFLLASFSNLKEILKLDEYQSSKTKTGIEVGSWRLPFPTVSLKDALYISSTSTPIFLNNLFAI